MANMTIDEAKLRSGATGVLDRPGARLVHEPKETQMKTDTAALVQPEWLAAHLHDPGARVVEVDVSSRAYDEWHIDGAVLWNVYQDLKDADYRLVDTASVERLLARSGISPDSTVVFYVRDVADLTGAGSQRPAGGRDRRDVLLRSVRRAVPEGLEGHEVLGRPVDGQRQVGFVGVHFPRSELPHVGAVWAHPEHRRLDVTVAHPHEDQVLAAGGVPGPVVLVHPVDAGL